MSDEDCYRLVLSWCQLFLSFCPAAVISGILYTRVLLVLRTTRTDRRKKVISIAFVLLWLSWVVLTVPYILLETILRWLGQETASSGDDLAYNAFIYTSVDIGAFRHLVYSLIFLSETFEGKISPNRTYLF